MSGYTFPDPFDPEETICFKVYVPKHAYYLAAFWRSYEYLTTWHAWQRDEAHTGKDVAALWRIAYDLARTAYEAGENCEGDMSLLLRVKPGFPNISQSSVDDGVTWVDFLIQPTWVGASGSSVVWPIPTSSDNRNSLAGGITSGTLTYFAHRVIEMDGDSLSRDEIQNNLEDEFRRFNALPGAINLVRPAIDAILDAPTPTVYDDDCVYADFWTSLKDLMTANPNDFNELLSNAFINFANDVGDEAMSLMSTIYYAFGGADKLYNMLADHESINKPTFGEACTYHHTWDFTISTQGWSIYENGAGASYTGGSGFSASGRGPAIHIAGPDRLVNKHKITFSGVCYGDTAVTFLNYDTSNGYGQSDIDAVTEWESGDLSEMPYYGGLHVGAEAAAGHTLGVYISKIEEWGVGFDPW